MPSRFSPAFEPLAVGGSSFAAHLEPFYGILGPTEIIRGCRTGGRAGARATEGEVRAVPEDSERTLGGIRLFGGFDPETLGSLERHCTWRRYSAKDKILDRDNDGSDVFFVVEGEVSVVNYSLGGREIALARIAAGSYFGELAAIDGQPRSASVVALKDCLVATMSPEAFGKLMLENRQLSTRVLQRLARIVRTCDDRIMDLSTLGAHQRVYLELLRLAERGPGGSGEWTIVPMPTQKEIAGRASTTRETVTRAISQVVAEGIAERVNKGLHIHDRKRLEELTAALSPDWDEESAR